MMDRGILFARQAEVKIGFIGDYYVLGSKKAAYFYLTIGGCSGYALTKEFLFKTLFKEFPLLHKEMLAVSFARYINDFSKPCKIKRKYIINKLNSRKKYSKISLDTFEGEHKKYHKLDRAHSEQISKHKMKITRDHEER